MHTFVSHARQLVPEIQPSKISIISAGVFVGRVAKDSLQKIELKTFHCSIINGHEALKSEQEQYKEILVIRRLDNTMVQLDFIKPSFFLSPYCL